MWIDIFFLWKKHWWTKANHDDHDWMHSHWLYRSKIVVCQKFILCNWFLFVCLHMLNAYTYTYTHIYTMDKKQTNRRKWCMMKWWLLSHWMTAWYEFSKQETKQNKIKSQNNDGMRPSIFLSVILSMESFCFFSLVEVWKQYENNVSLSPCVCVYTMYTIYMTRIVWNKKFFMKNHFNSYFFWFNSGFFPMIQF